MGEEQAAMSQVSQEGAMICIALGSVCCCVKCCGGEKKVHDKLAKMKKEKLDTEHPDRQAMEPLPLPIVILGAKYDIFQDMEPEKKKIVCKALRFFSHFYGATLQFYRYKPVSNILTI